MMGDDKGNFGKNSKIKGFLIVDGKVIVGKIPKVDRNVWER